MIPRARIHATLVVSGVLLLLPVHAIASQEAPARPVSEAIQRARALLDNGDGSAARILMDSLVAALPNASVDLVEALHWRAVLSESIGEAERDWKRLLVEAPLSSRAADALLRLAELEALRGSHQASRQHADRLVTEHASSVNKPRALLLIAKSWFAENNAGNACTALRELRGAATSVSGEIKLQSDELQPRCANIARNAGTATPSKPATNGKSLPASDKSVTTDKPTSATAAASDSATSTKTSAGETTRGQYSVQLAAYDRRSDADAMLKRLATMNIAARVEGSAAPYRVRTGRYATRAAAAEALAQLKKRGLNGFVAEPSRE